MMGVGGEMRHRPVLCLKLGSAVRACVCGSAFVRFHSSSLDNIQLLQVVTQDALPHSDQNGLRRLRVDGGRLMTKE